MGKIVEIAGLVTVGGQGTGMIVGKQFCSNRLRTESLYLCPKNSSANHMPVMGRLGLLTYRVPANGFAGIEGEKLAPPLCHGSRGNTMTGADVMEAKETP